MTERVYVLYHDHGYFSHREETTFIYKQGGLPDPEIVAMALGIDYNKERGDHIWIDSQDPLCLDDMLTNWKERKELERLAALPKKVKITAHLLVDTSDTKAEVYDGLNELLRPNGFILDWGYVENSAKAIDYDPENYQEGMFLEEPSDNVRLWMENFYNEKMVLDKFIKAHGGTWGVHRKYPKRDWADEAVNNDTVLGYWEWVKHKVESEDS